MSMKQNKQIIWMPGSGLQTAVGPFIGKQQALEFELTNPAGSYSDIPGRLVELKHPLQLRAWVLAKDSKMRLFHVKFELEVNATSAKTACKRAWNLLTSEERQGLPTGVVVDLSDGNVVVV